MKVLVIGGGGHGQVIIDIIERNPEFSLLGLLDDGLPRGQRVFGYEVFGQTAALEKEIEARSVEGVFIGVGDNWLRGEVVARVRQMAPQLKFPNAIHPSVQVSRGVRFGCGNVLMAGAILNINTVLGDFCVVNTRVSLDHDCLLGDFSSIGPGACLGGGVEVGAYSAIGLGVNLIHQVKVGAQTVVGAGSTVLGDLEAGCVAFGTPAKKVRTRVLGEPYL